MRLRVALRPRHLLVALALLAGLFAMHGLTHHGEHLPSAEVAAGGHHDADTSGHDGGSAAMTLCLAVLLGVSAGGLTLLGRRARRPLLLSRIARVDVVRRPRRTRLHDPPTPWSLSVCRC